MQVHPHFLFNTLHSISALLSKDTEAARKMISRLGDFLRLTLESGGAMEVTLQQEMEFLNGYLEIERIRFQDRLTTHIQIDPEVLKGYDYVARPFRHSFYCKFIPPAASSNHLCRCKSSERR